MNINNSFFIAVLLYSLTFIHAYSHNEKSNNDLLNTNAIYGNVGSGGLYFTATGYYERLLKQNMWERHISSFVKIGFGGETHWLGKGTYFLAQYGLLLGGKTHHLEMGLGPSYFIPGYFEGIFPSATVGWRIQKPGGSFIFRMGASVPEAIYLGVGVSF